jgi:nitrite reductase/ring-hydroxylating ferredoxin subunit
MIVRIGFAIAYKPLISKLLANYMLPSADSKPSESPGGRRGFLLSLGWVLLGLAFAAMTWMTGRFLGGSQARSDPEPVNFGPPDSRPLGSVTELGRVVLLRDGAGFWAVQAVCPHLGCQPAFDENRRIFVCPCHGSRFDWEGRLLAGPATTGLSLAALRLDSQGALVAYPKEKALPGDRFKP